MVEQLDMFGGSTLIVESAPPISQPEQLAWSLGDDSNRGQLAMSDELREDRRVRVFRRKCGWRFVCEVLEEGSWRVVQEREPGSAWSIDEALHRANTYAGMVGARVVR